MIIRFWLHWDWGNILIFYLYRLITIFIFISRVRLHCSIIFNRTCFALSFSILNWPIFEIFSILQKVSFGVLLIIHFINNNIINQFFFPLIGLQKIFNYEPGSLIIQFLFLKLLINRTSLKQVLIFIHQIIISRIILSLPSWVSELRIVVFVVHLIPWNGILVVINCTSAWRIKILHKYFISIIITFI